MTPVLWMVLAFAVLLGGAAYGYEWWRTRPPLPPPPWITREEVERMFLERDQRPVRWITEESVNARDQQLRELIASTPDEVHRIVITTLKGLPATYVPRAELIPLVAAYCRKALDEGGELRARILALPVAVVPSEIATLAAKADDAHARLTAAARKHPRPVRPAKKRARR